MSMQLATQTIGVVNQARWRSPGPNPRLGSVPAVLPVRHKLAVVGERGEGLVVGQLGGEGAAGGKLEEFAIRGRGQVAAAVTLHPPSILGEVVEGVDSEIGVLVVDRRVVAALGV